MDQRTSDVEADLKNILETRLALADKIQLLERRVEENIVGAKTAALDIISHAKETAVEFVESTTAQLNPSVQASRRPWVVVGGAIAVGLLAGWLDQRRQSSSRYAYAPAKAHPMDVMPSEGRGRPRDGVYPFYTSRETQAQERDAGHYPTQGGRTEGMVSQTFGQIASLLEECRGQFGKERERLQGAAIETARSFLEELPHIAVQSVVDWLTRRPRAGSAPSLAGGDRRDEAAHTRPRAAA